MSKYISEEEMQKSDLSHCKFHIVKHAKGEQTVVKDERGRLRWSPSLEKDTFSVREVYYRKDGKAKAVTETPIYYAYFDTPEEAKKELQNVLDSLNKNDVLDFKTIGAYTNEPDKEQ